MFVYVPSVNLRDELQPNNGIPVVSFYDDPNDHAFDEVTKVLDEIKGVTDVRILLQKKYGLGNKPAARQLTEEYYTRGVVPPEASSLSSRAAHGVQG